MRRLLCLAALGLFPLSGVTAAGRPPSREPVPLPVARSAGIEGEAVRSGNSRRLVLSVTRQRRSESVTSRVLLLCDPPGGRHPDPAGACGALEKGNGDPADLGPLPDAVCTLQYEPVTATAFGTWDGRLIGFRQTYGNPCRLRVATGPVFSFGGV